MSRTCALVGQQPNAATVGRPALWLLPDDTGIYHAANRLLEYTGWSAEDYLRIFEVRTNVWLEAEGTPARLGARRALEIARNACAMPDTVRILLLGAKPRDAFRMTAEEKMRWTPLFGSTRVEVAWIPHPSGRDNWWNDAAHRASALRFFAELRDWSRR